MTTEIALKVKPFSINKAWSGGPRHRTREYNEWKRIASTYLMGKCNRHKGWVNIYIWVYVNSYLQSDTDNFVKTTLDFLQEYAVIANDNKVKRIEIEKFQDKNERIELIIQDV